MSEDIKVQFQRLVDEVINAENFDRIEEFVTPGETYNGLEIGPESVRANHKGIREAFPDFHISIDRMVAEGDMLAVEMTWSGNHMRRFRGIEATGKHVSFVIMLIVVPHSHLAQRRYIRYTYSVPQHLSFTCGTSSLSP